MNRNRDDNQLIVTFYDSDQHTVLKKEYVDKCGSATPPKDPTRPCKTFAGWVGRYEEVACNENVYATYNDIDYVVTFKSHDGIILKTQHVAYGGSAKEPPIIPVWEGHSFTGWDKPFSYITESTVVTALYDANTIKLTFVKYKDEEEPWFDIDIPVGTSYTLPDPEDGDVAWSFDYWVGNKDIYTQDTTIIARYKDAEETSYTYEFYEPLPGGQWAKITSFEHSGNIAWEDLYEEFVEDKIEMSTAFYKLLGWAEIQGSKEKINDDKVFSGGRFYAIVKELPYEIQFVEYELEDGYYQEYKAIVNCKAGEAFNVPDFNTDPTFKKYEGLTFKQWEPFYTSSNVDYFRRGVKTFNLPTTATSGLQEDDRVYMTYQARFENKIYKVTFVNYDYSLVKEFYCEYGHSVSDADVPQPTKKPNPDAIFTGWIGSLENVIHDTVIIAGFRDHATFTVSFTNWDDSLIERNVYNQDEIPSCSVIPERPSDEVYSYVFEKWNPDITIVVSDETYKASFISIPQEYNITFLNYDGSVVQSKKVLSIDDISCDIIPEKPDDEYGSYEFIGWNPEITPGMKPRSDMEFTANFKLIENKFTVRFLMDDGITVIKSEDLSFGNTPIPPDTPTKESTIEYDYVFSGWDKDVVPVIEDTDYIATFFESTRSYNITFKNGEEILQSSSFLYGKMPVYDGPEPTRPEEESEAFVIRYTFNGWNPEVVIVNGDATYQARFSSNFLRKHTITYFGMELESDGHGGGDAKIIKQEIVLDGESGTLPSVDEIGATKIFKDITDADIVWSQSVENVHSSLIVEPTIRGLESENFIFDIGLTGSNNEESYIYYNLLHFSVYPSSTAFLYTPVTTEIIDNMEIGVNDSFLDIKSKFDNFIITNDNTLSSLDILQSPKYSIDSFVSGGDTLSLDLDIKNCANFKKLNLVTFLNSIDNDRFKYQDLSEHAILNFGENIETQSNYGNLTIREI